MIRVHGIVRMCKDAELRNVKDTQVADMRVATTERNGESSFWNCQAWGHSAELIARYAPKGKSLYIEGDLQVNNYEKDGMKHTMTRIHISYFEFLGKKVDGEEK